MTLEQIRKKRKELYEIAKKYDVTKIYVIGSVARGETTDKSDVDFFLETSNEASAFGVCGFQYEAEKLLGKMVDIVPDLVLLKEEDTDFLRNIQTDRVVL